MPELMSTPIHDIRRIDPAVGCYFVRWRQPLSAEGYRLFLDDLLSRPDFRTEMCSLHDYRGVAAAPTMTDLKRAALATIAGAARRGPSRAAILVDNDLNHGLARIYAAEVDSDAIERAVFREPAAALLWLGLPADYPIPEDTA